MHPNDREAFVSTLTQAMAYYGKECSPFVVGIFWDGLSRFGLDEVQRAFGIHANDPDRGQFAPKIADITRLLEGSTATQGMRAWAVVERALRSVGSYQTVVFDDPLIHAVISDMGGWIKLCQTPADELPFRARDFERAYSAFKHRREMPPYPAKLIGIAEADNAAAGFKVAPPVLIGNPDKAMRVMQHGGSGPALRLTQAAVADGVVAMIAQGDRA